MRSSRLRAGDDIRHINNDSDSEVQPILEIDKLNISFFVRAGEIPAVMDFSCKIMPGETMGLVGESG